MTRRVTVETRLKCVTREQENVQTVQTDGRETPAMVRDLKFIFCHKSQTTVKVLVLTNIIVLSYYVYLEFVQLVLTSSSKSSLYCHAIITMLYWKDVPPSPSTVFIEETSS